MKKKIVMQKLIALALSAAMAAGMCPVTAFAVTKDQVAADGTYTKTAHVVNDSDDGDEWNEYDVEVSLTVKDGVFSDVVLTPGDAYDDTESKAYFNKVYEKDTKKTTSIKTALTGKAATEDTVNAWDTVSGATCTAKAVKQAALEAIQSASAPAQKEEYVYAYAGLAWAEYWAAEDVYAAGSTASSEAADAKGELDKGAFDVVTRATSNHGLHRGSFQCNAVIEAEDGTTYNVSYWSTDGKTLYLTDGTSVGFNRGTITKADGTTTTLKDYKVTGLKFVPVKVKAEDYEAFKAAYPVYENGSELKGGYGENKLSVIDEIANVTENTNGLKTVTKNADGSFSFSKKASGTDSGIKDQALKTASGLEPEVKAANGSYGEFLRVDFNGDYGDLAANMQTVTWTYYGNDSTYTNALRTYGTKFASDNWMHKAMGIQLGLTDSLRCQLPDGYDGTGYWTITISALGYQDYTYSFEAKEENIVYPSADEASKEALSAKVKEAEALDQTLYTEKTWANLETELQEAKDVLAEEDVKQPVVNEALSHLTDAMVNLKSQYILMNIPYDAFYAADVNNDVKVDAFTSATKSKTRSGSLAAGSYHVDNSGDAITGVTFPVKITDDTDLSSYTQITDDSAVDITVTNHGQTSTTTYAGKDALFESASYSYYVLNEVPSYYKEAVVTDGKLSFGKTVGEAKELKDVTAEFTTSSKYGDYELDFDGLKDAMGYGDSDQVYGVIVSTDENDYGMRHIENIWKVKELAWSTGFTTAVHGCQTSSAHYEAMMGQTINKVTYYTSKGIFTIPVNIYVPVKTGAEASLENAVLSAGKTTLTLAIPRDFEPEYTFSAEGFTVEEDKTVASAARSKTENVTHTVTVSYDQAMKNGAYTLTVSDKNKKYADVTASFELYSDSNPAVFNGTMKAPALIPAEDVTDEAFASYIKAIKTVTVNGTDYAASGKRAVAIVKEDGTIDTTAKAFADGTKFEITVSATGYQPVSFNYEAVDSSKLEALISQAEALHKADYTEESWNNLASNLAGAKGALAKSESQNALDQAENTLNEAIQALVKVDDNNNNDNNNNDNNDNNNNGNNNNNNSNNNNSNNNNSNNNNTGNGGTTSGNTNTGNNGNTGGSTNTGNSSNLNTGSTASTGASAPQNTQKTASANKAASPDTGDMNSLFGMFLVLFGTIGIFVGAFFRRKRV